MTVLLASLAFWALRDIGRARLCFARSSPRVDRAPRVRALRSAVSSLIVHAADSERRMGLLAAALAELRRVGFAGFALLIEALPNDDSTVPGTLGNAVAQRDRQRIAATGRVCERANGAPSLHAPNAARPPDVPCAVDEIDVQIDALIRELERMAPLTAEHSRAVSAWCARIARKLGLDAEEVVYLARCGLIHDVGKVLTPSAILEAPRQLSTAEWSVMQLHAGNGAHIVSSLPDLRRFVPIVRGHHERIDGRGYPDGLRTSAIPLAARIVTVADSFNAMIGRRPYRLPLAPTAALEELHRHSHSQFDPEIVEAMTRIVMGRALEG
jgi:putative nucleotidyltransferase with HDIG domain